PWIELDRMHLGLWHFVHDREADGSRSGAQFDHDGRASVRERRLRDLDRPARDLLGLRTRDEHSGTDLDVDVPESGGPRDVLQRHPTRTRLDHLQVGLALRGVYRGTAQHRTWRAE